MVQTLYRGEVTEVRADGVMVHVPDLGYKMQFGPCQTNDFPLSIGDGVLMAQASGFKEDLVVVGPLKMYVPHPDVTYGVYDFVDKVARGIKFNGLAMPIGPTIALVESTGDIYWWDQIGVASNQTGSVIDGFTNSAVSALKWTALSGGVTFDVPNTRAVLPVISSYSTMDTDAAHRYTLVNSYIAAKLSITTSASRELYMEAVSDANNRVSMLVSGTTLYARIKSASTTVFQVTATYDPTNHAWWRFRHDGTYIYFETSADGNNWNSFATYTIQVSDTVWSDVYVQFSAGYYATESASNAYVSNVNVPLWWKGILDADKSPKFNNLTLRGSLTAAGATINGATAITGTTTITGDETVTGLVTAGNEVVSGTSTITKVQVKTGTFWYNGTPGAGNLYASAAAVAGTDAFGNLYKAGFCTYRTTQMGLKPLDDGTHVYQEARLTPTGGTGSASLTVTPPGDTTNPSDGLASLALTNRGSATSNLAQANLSGDTVTLTGSNGGITMASPVKHTGVPPLSNGVFIIARYFVEATSGAVANSTGSVDVPGATITVNVPTVGSNPNVNWRVIAHADIACTTLATNVAGQVALFLDGVAMAGARTMRLVAGTVNDGATVSRTYDGNAALVAGSSHTWKLATNLSTGNTARYSVQAPATCFTLEFYL